MDDGFKILRHRQFPKIGGRAVREGVKREAPAKRGYDYIWSKVSTRFRRGHPFCRFCEQKGFEATPADVVDHIIPVEDGPDLRLTWSNFQSLCNSCHNGLKRRLEAYAREHEMIDKLPEWCANPESRPRKLRR
jgi:5-methylcytosine-specific restriction endonuclease McrA